MDKELKDQVAVITGGSGAIGNAIGHALQASGARPVALDLNPNPAFPSTTCDVSSEDSVRAAVKKTMDEYGRIDIAIHAAGISHDAVVWKLDPADWDRILSVNLRGAYLLVHEVVPIMRTAGMGGRVIFIGSINGSRGKFGTAAYSASKAGLLGLAKSVAREVGRFGITANTVEPGWVRTPLTERVPAEIQKKALEESLIGRFVEPGEIAAAVRYLCSSHAAAVTGQILRVDGGQFLGPH